MKNTFAVLKEIKLNYSSKGLAVPKELFEKLDEAKLQDKADMLGEPVEKLIKEESEGVGTELRKLIEWFPLPKNTSCGPCKRLEQDMNRWGVQGCIERREYIISRLIQHAAKIRAPFKRLTANILVDRAIKLAQGIEDTNQNPEE